MITVELGSTYEEMAGALAVFLKLGITGKVSFKDGMWGMAVPAD